MPAAAAANDQPSRLHAQARALAETGIKVFPCAVNGKEPATAHGFKDASADPAQIDAWWSEADYNIGMCPEDAGWAVVDLDPGGETPWLETLTTNGGYEPTYEVSTPRGGRHIYFAGSLPSSAGKLAEHVDTRGIGGYVVVPPSIVNGRPYTVMYDRPIAELPAWIAQRLAAKSTSREATGYVEPDTAPNIARATSALRADLERNGEPRDGEASDNRAYAVAAICRDLGVSEDRTAALMHDLWAPHFDRDWIDDKVRHVWRYAQNAPGVDAVVGSAAETFGNTDAFREALKASNDNARLLSSWDDWKDMPFPEWLFENLLPAGSIVTVNGKSQSFKSFIVGELLYSLATGKPAFGTREPETIGACVYVPVEGKYSFKAQRMKALVKDRGAVPRDLYVYEKVPQVGLPADCGELVTHLRTIHERTPIKAVALDHASGVLGGLSANDRENLNLLWHLARRLINEFGCTVIVVVHPPKSAADDEANGAGSYGFFADVDTFLQVSRTKGTHNAKIEVAKQKDGEAGREVFLKARLISLGHDLKGRPVSSFVLDETSAEAVADERDGDRVTVELALERSEATSERSALDTEDLARAIARLSDPAFPEHRTAVSGGQADALDKARKLVRRMRDSDGAADLWFKVGSGRGAYRWRLRPESERILLPARREPATAGTVPDRKEGEL